MNPFFEYLIKSTLSLALFYIVFKLAVSRDKMHSVNRFVLLGILFISAILPFTNLPIISKTEIIPAPRIEVFSEIKAAPVFTEPEITPVTNTVQTVVLPHSIHINWLLLFYLLAVSLLVLRIIISTVKVLRIIGNAEKQRFRKIILAVAKEFIQPFSFLKYIVISEKDYTENRNIVVAHEQAHIQNYHSVDLIICELFTLLHWFNPFMWLLRHDLKLIHEFQADETVLNKGIDAKKYQLLVLQKSVGERRFAMANHFAQKPILKRLKMMQNRNKKQWNVVKLILFIPVVLLLLQAFAKPEIITESTDKTTTSFVQQTNGDLEQIKNLFSDEEKSAIIKPSPPVNELHNKNSETKVKKEFSEKEEISRNVGVECVNDFREQETAPNNEIAPKITPEPDIAKACSITLGENLLFVDNKPVTLSELQGVVEEKIEQSKNINAIELRVFKGTSESRIENVNGILNRVAGLNRIIKTLIPPPPPPIYISINSNGELKVGNDRFTSYDEFEDKLIEIERSVEKEYKSIGGNRYLVAKVKIKTGTTYSDFNRLKESLQKANILNINYYKEETALQNSNCKSENFGNGLVKTFGKNGKIGLATKSGNQILANEYDEIEFYGNYIKTVKDGKYGLYSKGGNVLLRNEYSKIEFYGNYIKTVKDGKHGLYSKSGNVLLRNEYSDISFYGNYIKTVKGSKYGLCSTSGNVLLRNEYSDISMYGNYIRTVKDSKYGLCSKSGNVLLRNEYSDISMYGNYIKTIKDRKYGLCSKSGNVLFRNEYSDIYLYGNYIKTVKNRKYGLYSKSGNIILRNEYDDISLADSYLKTVKNGKAGLADSRGNILIPNEYDKLEVKGKKVRLVKDSTKKTITL